MLEDAALGAGLVLVHELKLTLGQAFWACFLGISIGDIGLYALGRGGLRVVSSRWLPRHFKFKAALNSKVTARSTSLPPKPRELIMGWSIFAARALPGARLPAYIGAGVMQYPFPRFLLITLLSVALWVGSILTFGQGLLATQKASLAFGLSAVIVVCWIAKKILKVVSDPWRRKAALHSWRRWLHFEFWPNWLFYLPVIPIYLYQSAKGKSLLLPFYANPEILNGGLIGESKFEILAWLSHADRATLPAILVRRSEGAANILSRAQACGISFPFILKPDVGQRGYGVRVIESREDLEQDLSLRDDSPLVVQKLSSMPKEAGVFYFRKPGESVGTIFSITDKVLPSVFADGCSRLGDLILKDKRARVIAQVYFDRLQGQLNDIYPAGHEIQLARCGNHCQGAIFKNGAGLITEALTLRFDAIAKTIPNFHFGRFDIKYRSAESLMAGLDFDFEIVEVNGAGAEATHIWDGNTQLWDAYLTLAAQWGILFEIGKEVKTNPKLKANVSLSGFLRESLRVFKRRDNFSISS